MCLCLCLCVNDHLYGFYGVAEYFLQNRQIISVHGGHFSLFKLGREPGRGDRSHKLKWLVNIASFLPPFNLLNGVNISKNETDLPARPAICRACDVLMVSICFSPFSLTLGFTRLLKMIRFILLERGGGFTEVMKWPFNILFKLFLKEKEENNLIIIQCVCWYLQVKAHSNSICSNQYLAGVIGVIELLGL